MSFNADQAVAVLAAGLAYSTVVSSVEFARNRRLVAQGGLLDWEVLQTRTRLAATLSRVPWPGWTAGPVGWIALCTLRGVAGFAAFPVTGVVTTLSAVALVVVGLTTLIVMYRLMFGLDGSDQLVAVLSIAVGAAALVGGPGSRIAVCWFVTLMVTISYLTAGITKVLSATWRRGDALALIMRTEAYGNPRLVPIARSNLGRLATRVVIILELAFPLVYLGSPAVTLVVLGSLAAFHAASALLMGLNGFLPTYVSTFACVFWVSQHLWW